MHFFKGTQRDSSRGARKSSGHRTEKVDKKEKLYFTYDKRNTPARGTKYELYVRKTDPCNVPRVFAILASRGALLDLPPVRRRSRASTLVLAIHF